MKKTNNFFKKLEDLLSTSISWALTLTVLGGLIVLLILVYKISFVLLTGSGKGSIYDLF
jgi:hypothetical protein